MNTQQILADITSRDTTKVWSSACEIINNSHNKAAIKELVPHLADIITATKGLDMGGIFAPNKRFVDFAIRLIQFHDSSSDCTCSLYPEYGFNPNNEINKGHVKLLDTVMLEGGYVDYYILECNTCTKQFKTIEREYHYTWWQWDILT